MSLKPEKPKEIFLEEGYRQKLLINGIYSFISLIYREYDLKEIAHLCDISKNLTFHMARHTFATTVTLNNGVSLESVSSMLGHKSVRTTQLYARILSKRVDEDMEKLDSKFSNRINKYTHNGAS